MALIAFVLAVLLIRPWERVTPEDLPSPNIALLPTATFTPTRRPTLERPPTVATRASPTEVPVAAITIPPTRTPTPTPITPTPTRPATYVVVEGDTPSEIAMRFGVTTAELLQANGLSLRALLSIGQELAIPVATGGEAEAQNSTPVAGPATPTGTAEATATPAPTDTPTFTPSPTSSPTAVPTPSPTPTRRSGAFTYVVESGDTLSEIANANGLATADLAEANGLSVRAVLQVGQELVIPVPLEETAGPASAASVAGTATATAAATSAPLVHVVRSGEHLGLIAARYDVSMAEIAAANGIGVSSILSIGQELIIPGRYAEAPPATATATATPEPTDAAAPSDSAASEATAEATAGVTDTPGTPAPVQVVHVVAQGDTLGSIAVKYDVPAERIAAANGISLNSVLRIGQELLIPDTSLTPTPTMTPTATLSPTPTPTLSPTPTTTPVPGFIYGPPRLLAPVDGTIYYGEEANILVNWTSVGILPEDEWYVVRLWRSEGDTEPVTAWTKATSWRIPQSLYPAEGESSYLLWQVNVMRRALGAQTGVAISPSSAIYQFEWR